MKSSIRQARYFKSTGAKIAVALALASLISSMSISPVYAAKDDGHKRAAQRGAHGQRDHHEVRERNEYRPQYRPQYRRPYNYAQPVYVPPPVYYEPRQSPGISLFFPLDLRR
jgi:hypothetical protein